MDFQSCYMDRIDALWATASNAKRKMYMGALLDPTKASIKSHGCPFLFSKTVADLTEDQKKCVEEIGLESLLGLKCIYVCKPLVEELIKNIDPSSGQITVHGVPFELSVESFEVVMGLKDREVNKTQMQALPEHVKEQLDIIAPNGAAIHISNLRDYIVKTAMADDAFKVVFALYAYGTMLCPSVSGVVDRGILVQLQDVNAIWRVKWAAISLSHLLEGVRIYKMDPTKYFSGSVIFLQLFYCHLLVRELSIRTHSVAPGRYWTLRRVRSLIRWVLGHGGLRSSLILAYSRDDRVCREEYMVLHSELERIKDVKRSKMHSTVNQLVDARLKRLFSQAVTGEPDTPVAKRNARNGGAANAEFVEPIMEDNLWEKSPNECKIDAELFTEHQKGQVNSLQTDMASPHEKEKLVRPNLDPLVSATNAEMKNCTPDAKGVEGKEMKKVSRKNQPRRKQYPPAMADEESRTLYEEKVYRYMSCLGKKDDKEWCSEIVANFGVTWLTRDILRCLEPKKPLFAEVINAMAIVLQERDSPYWFFPTWFDGMARATQVSVTKDANLEWVRRTQDVARLDEFNTERIRESKIFIPIRHALDDKIDGNGHFFLLIVDTPRRTVMATKIYNKVQYIKFLLNDARPCSDHA